mgnify:CR=1 FL=1
MAVLQKKRDLRDMNYYDLTLYVFFFFFFVKIQMWVHEIIFIIALTMNSPWANASIFFKHDMLIKMHFDMQKFALVSNDVDEEEENYDCWC